jgi:hypothetical protein
MPGFWTIATALMLATAILSIVMERRRHNRADIEKVGFMPWNHILIIALVMTAFSAGLAAREFL